MSRLNVARRHGAKALPARFKKGMAIIMSDGWRGTVRFLADGYVHCDHVGANPHLTGRAIKESLVTVTGDTAHGDWNLSLLLNKILGTVPTLTADREQRRAAEQKRAQMEREWAGLPD